MKYIPADKLIVEIRKLRSESCISESDDYYEYAKSEIIDIITSLQQERSGVDLEKEIKDKYSRDTSTLKTREEYAKLARHFYELGLNLRNK